MLITADWFISLLPRIHPFPREGNARQMLLDLRPAGLNSSRSAVREHCLQPGLPRAHPLQVVMPRLGIWCFSLFFLVAAHDLPLLSVPYKAPVPLI